MLPSAKHTLCPAIVAEANVPILALIWVPVAVAKVKRPVEAKFVVVAFVALKLVAPRFVAKRLVDVVLVPVAFVQVRFVTVRLVMVEGLVTARVVKVALVPINVFTLRLVSVLVVAVRALNEASPVEAKFVVVAFVAPRFVAKKFVDVAFVLVVLPNSAFQRLLDVPSEYARSVVGTRLDETVPETTSVEVTVSEDAVAPPKNERAVEVNAPRPVTEASVSASAPAG